MTLWSDNIKSAIDNSDLVIPLAALVGAPLCDKYPEIALSLNQEWFDQLVKYLDYQKVIYPNTNSGYGTTNGDMCKNSGKIEHVKATFDKYNIHHKRNFGSIPTQHRAFADMGYKLGDFPNAE